MSFQKPLLISFLFLLHFSCNEKKDLPQKQYIYYENGAVRREYFVQNGIRNGVMTDFYPDGKRKAIRYLVNDIQVGKTTIFHPDGNSIREVQYYSSDGKREKGDTLWYTNGNIEFTADFANDKKNGIMSRYDTTGVLLYRASFKNDSLLEVLK
jgi:antitoxin component YwqK of YwqJK toxin-antitoxin module